MLTFVTLRRCSSLWYFGCCTKHNFALLCFVFISLESTWSEYIMNTKVVQDMNSAANWTNSTTNLTATDEVPSSSSLLVVQVLLGGISVSAFLGNWLVCVVIIRNRKILRSAYNTFLFSLAITDMLTGNRCEISDFSCLMTEKWFLHSDWLRAN